MSKPMLFTGLMMGPHTLANRVAMNPMTRCRADVDAVPTDIMATYYGQRASAGLIITEGTAPSPNGRGYARTPGLWNAAQVAGWQPVTAAVKVQGGTIFAQIMHTGRVSHPENMPAGARVVAPSAVRLGGQMYTDSLGMQDHPIPEEMTEADIAQARDEFVASARNAMAAGFDGVELHAANGYLLEQFLCPVTNQRSDGWGGSVANRIRFVVEVSQAVVAAIGADHVGIRISPFSTASGMQVYPEVEETYLALTRALAETGMVYLHLVNQFGDGSHVMSRAFKQQIRAAWPKCLIIGGTLDGAAAAEEVLQDGLADMVGFGRSYISNPDLVARLQSGAPLAEADGATFYSPGPKGYIDYPTLG